MNFIIYPTQHELANAAASEMIALLKNKPNAVICMASGNSPKLTCDSFAKLVQSNTVDTGQFFFIGLDEWIGIPPNTKGSCHYDFQERIFNPFNLDASRYHLFNSLADDLQKECLKMDSIIAEKGGIDLMIVGIGMNGHIGFNEPGTEFSLRSHVVSLHPLTSSVGQQYFDVPMKLEKGITLGFEHLLNTHRVLLLANGNAKASVIKQAVEGPITKDLPASVLQQHKNACIMIDEEAGAMLSK